MAKNIFFIPLDQIDSLILVIVFKLVRISKLQVIIMSEAQLINQLKFRVATLENNLLDRNKQLQDYKTIQIQADSKIKALNKIQADKVKNLLNSIQILKKEKASIENLSKQHKRSKLIEQLNKEILDQDIVIDVLRNSIYDEKGKDKGRQFCDQMIIKTLTKGPDRIRPLTRQELRMEIEKLKALHMNMENKMKIGDKKGKGGKQADNQSDISSVSERSFVNQNQQIYKKLKQLQQQNENIKLEMTSKGKIIEKLKSDIKQKDKLRSQMQLVVNQLQIASRKISTYERLLRESKENVNNKIVELYQRQLRVQELQLNTQQNSQKLKHAHQSTNILLQELKQEKEQLNVEIQLLKKQNQTILLQNMTLKKRQQEQKSKITEIRDINNKNKQEISDKLKRYEEEMTRMVQQRDRYMLISRNYETMIFKERSQWVQQKSKLIQQIQQLETRHDSAKLNNKVMNQIDQLRKDNQNLKEIIESGSGGNNNDNKLLLERLQNYRMRLQFYENDKQGSNKNKERQLYDSLFDKYNSLLQEFEKYMKQGNITKKHPRRKNIIELTRKQEIKLDNISSGLSNLNLQDIDSDILDNFDSDYEYSLRINQFDQKKMRNVPKISQEDKELLKLLNSDLWDFVKDDLVKKKLQQIIDPIEGEYKAQDEKLMKRIRQIKNISHPMGKKMVFFDSQLRDIDQMSDSVSITSAIAKEIQKYDSDVNIEVKRGVKGALKVNMKNYGNISDSYNSHDVSLSSMKSGDSSFVKKAKGQKASVLKIGSKQSLSGFSSNNNESDLMDSDVSSININQSVLKEMDSEVSVDFRKRKNLKKK